MPVSYFGSGGVSVVEPCTCHPQGLFRAERPYGMESAIRGSQQPIAYYEPANEPRLPLNKISTDKQNYQWKNRSQKSSKAVAN